MTTLPPAKTEGQEEQRQAKELSQQTKRQPKELFPGINLGIRRKKDRHAPESAETETLPENESLLVAATDEATASAITLEDQQQLIRKSRRKH